MTLPTTVVDFTAGDGLALNLHRVEREGPAPRGPVLLVHGAGVRVDIFQPPTQRTLVEELVDAGYDVWLVNWRASMDVAPNPWTLDQAAAYDHPMAVRTILEHTGADSVQAVVHCQGSTSFMMSAAAGLVPEVRTIVSNAVSLHPVIPRFSRFKGARLGPIIERFTPHLDPSWGNRAPTPVAKVITALVQATHPECSNDVCRMVSFTYGSGRPALWRHENLDDATHEWIRGQFGQVPFTFFNDIMACVEQGGLVSVDGLPGLPTSFTAQPPKTDASIVLVAGARNRCFLPDSQVSTHRWLEQVQPGRHRLHVFPGYGHLDVFIGSRAHEDVFPTILAELSAG